MLCWGDAVKALASLSKTGPMLSWLQCAGQLIRMSDLHTRLGFTFPLSRYQENTIPTAVLGGGRASACCRADGAAKRCLGFRVQGWDRVVTDPRTGQDYLVLSARHAEELHLIIESVCSRLEDVHQITN